MTKLYKYRAFCPKCKTFYGTDFKNPARCYTCSKYGKSPARVLRQQKEQNRSSTRQEMALSEELGGWHDY